MLASEILRRVREIQIRTGRQVADVLAGQYVSVFKGRGIEFDEVRPYVPGDDVRAIDWNVTARTGEPFVKRYIEERQLTIMLMADVSASQDFGSAHRSKREATAELCALLAFSATLNDDKVGLTLFHSEIEQYIPARKGQKHSLRVVREVLAHGMDVAPGVEHQAGQPRRRWNWWPRRARRRRSAREATHIAAAMEFLLSVRARKTVCFVVSDFLDEGFLPAMQMANRKHDIVAVCVTDPREWDLPNVGLVTVRDAETGRQLDLDTGSETLRTKMREQSEQRVEALRQEFQKSKIDFIQIDASQSVVEPLVQFFKLREKRQRR